MTDSKLHDELISALHKFIKEKDLLSHYILDDKMLNYIRYKCEILTPHYISNIFDEVYYQGGCYRYLFPLDLQTEWKDIANNITIKYAIRLLKKQDRLIYRGIRCWYNHMPITYKHILEFLSIDRKKYIADNIFMTYEELLTICDNIKKES